MTKILNYTVTTHFDEQIRKRRIEPFAISLCLAKGRIKTDKSKRRRYILDKDEIERAINQGYLSFTDYLNVKSVTVILRGSRLITAYKKFGDTGITNFKTITRHVK